MTEPMSANETPRVSVVQRSLRDELAFLLDPTVDLPSDAYDRETLLMRLECAFIIRSADARATIASLRADLDCAAEALVELRLIAGAAGRINEADAHLTSLGFAYPFTGRRALAGHTSTSHPEGR